MTHYFPHTEAKSKLGKTVVTKVPFFQLPKGSIGKVVDIYKMQWPGFGVVVSWNNYDFSDGFSKDDYEEFLEEV